LSRIHSDIHPLDSITLLILFLLYDVRTEKRRYFQMTFGIAVGMGILWYGNYLFTLIRQVKGI